MEYLLVEPEFPINVGSIARVLMNFGVRQLHIVNPKFNLEEKEVKMFAKKAYILVKKAKIYKTMDDTIKKINPKLVVGTTGVQGRFRRGIMRKLIPLDEAVKKLGIQGKVLVVFGRESTGLNKHESSLCHFFINIPTSEKYPVMNLSHSVAVVAYELEKIKKQDDEVGNIENMCKMFNSFVDTLSLMTQIRKSKKIKQSFRNVVSRGLPTPKEADSVVAVFYRAEKVLGKRLKKAVRK